MVCVCFCVLLFSMCFVFVVCFLLCCYCLFYDVLLSYVGFVYCILFLCYCLIALRLLMCVLRSCLFLCFCVCPNWSKFMEEGIKMLNWVSGSAHSFSKVGFGPCLKNAWLTQNYVFVPLLCSWHFFCFVVHAHFVKNNCVSCFCNKKVLCYNKQP